MKTIARRTVVLAGEKTLVKDLRKLISGAQSHTAQAVNAALTTLYWQIGKRVNDALLRRQRATYGTKLIISVGKSLEATFGSGFGEKNLRHMVRFAEVFPDEKIVSALRRQLGWSHFKRVIYMEDPLKRDFYAELCRVEGWSTRVLDQKVGSMLFERTALSKRPAALIRRELNALRKTDELTPEFVLQDPYMLDFLNLKDTFSEKDLEGAILREIERFVLELGTGFAFLERQKRITVDGEDHYIDLLFFHRKLKRLVVVELKLGEFKAADSGQVELYLRWLDRHEREAGERAPIGIILCAGKKSETVEYLGLDKRNIHVAEYVTELPSREVLQNKLHVALRAARQRVAAA
ncbi:MAG: PDDEXK nuclease domain-containing protein [Archangium sp.]